MFTLVVMSIVSQYRSHGYLFNQVMDDVEAVKVMSQYRSHGYLFNQYKFTTQDGQERLNTVLTVISLIS